MHTATKDEHPISQLHDGEPPEVEHVYPMTSGREYCEEEWESVEENEEDMNCYYSLDEARQEPFR